MRPETQPNLSMRTISEMLVSHRSTVWLGRSGCRGFEFDGAPVKVRTVTDSRLFPSFVTGRANGPNQVVGL